MIRSKQQLITAPDQDTVDFEAFAKTMLVKFLN